MSRKTKVTKTCKTCNQDFLIYPIINGKQLRLSKRLHCLICFPLHKRMKEKEKPGINKLCRLCAKLLPLNDFSNNNKDGYKTSYCKNCQSKKQRNSRQRFKLDCISYKGGSCSRCGYNKCQDALEFHHLNPEEKDFQISRHPSTNFNDKIRTELDKCELVCSNCHKEIHNKLYHESFLEKINKFD